jgi:hypothetical protein
MLLPDFLHMCLERHMGEKIDGSIVALAIFWFGFSVYVVINITNFVYKISKLKNNNSVSK